MYSGVIYSSEIINVRPLIDEIVGCLGWLVVMSFETIFQSILLSHLLQREREKEKRNDRGK